MKKSGFTLAEILISLGLIGVVAAMTMPVFTQSTQTAKIGPQLAKAVSTFEQGVEAVLADEEADSIIGSGLCNQTETSDTTAGAQSADAENGVEASNVTICDMSNFWNKMSTHLRGTKTNTHHFILQDGTEFALGYTDPQSNVMDGRLIKLSKADNGNPTTANMVMIDINGNAGPNKTAKDQFFFILWDDGSLRPVGSMRWAGNNSDTTWETACPANTAVAGTNKIYCAGHIFENGLKVSYK